MITGRYSLSQAAKLIGVNRHTLRRWLEVDLGYRMPDVPRGGKILLSERDIEAVLKKHCPRVDLQLLRRGRAA